MLMFTIRVGCRCSLMVGYNWSVTWHAPASYRRIGHLCFSQPAVRCPKAICALDHKLAIFSIKRKWKRDELMANHSLWLSLVECNIYTGKMSFFYGKNRAKAICALVSTHSWAKCSDLKAIRVPVERLRLPSLTRPIWVRRNYNNAK
jgi:hypothetical protein